MGSFHKPLSERFWAKVNRGGPDDCWLWTAAVAGHMGYGNIASGDGRFLKSHRLSWQMHNGDIPKGMMVCHTCDVPRCVNPNHLFLGTNSDNIKDAVRKGRHKVVRFLGEKNPMVKLTEAQAREVFSMPGTHQAIADAYGVNRATVSLIKRKVNWSWIHDPS